MDFDAAQNLTTNWHPLESEEKAKILPSRKSQNFDPDFAGLVPYFQERNNVIELRKAKAMPAPPPADLVQQMPSRTIEFRIASRETSKLTHKAYSRLRRDFAAAAQQEMFEKWQGVYRKKQLADLVAFYDVHHKLPILLGGSNDHDNLVLIDRPVHKAIHKLVDRKMANIQDVLRLHRQSRKVLWKSLKMDLQEIEGVRLDDAGRIMMTIPFPKGKIFVPPSALLGLSTISRTTSYRGRPRAQPI